MTTFGSLKFEKIEKQVSAEVKLETVLGLQIAKSKCIASFFSIAFKSMLQRHSQDFCKGVLKFFQLPRLTVCACACNEVGGFVFVCHTCTHKAL